MNSRETSEYSILTEAEKEALQRCRKSILQDNIITACGILCLASLVIRSSMNCPTELIDVILLYFGANGTLFGAGLGLGDVIRYEKKEEQIYKRAKERNRKKRGW